MQTTPFRFRDIDRGILITNEVGDYGLFDADILNRFFSDQLTESDTSRLKALSILVDTSAEWKLTSLMTRLRLRTERTPTRLNYLMIVPTLRCDLSCSYCQVSRAPLEAKGFDWDEQRLAEFESFLQGKDGAGPLKLEFQGGEPTLRPDLLLKIMNICSREFSKVEFVICTNLTRITPEVEALIARDDVVISTSVDGPLRVMSENRTSDDHLSKRIIRNLEYIIRKYGQAKVSALPTITDNVIAKPEMLIDTYRDMGFDSIFLRPVNFMGFARKRYANLTAEFSKWRSFYQKAIEYIVAVNKTHYFEEVYLSLLVRSIFADLPHGFVDFRSPSKFLRDYGIIDFDGKLYPTDEARMLSRVKHIDLSSGSMAKGVNASKIRDLEVHAIHHVDPDCQHCAYMPYCGIDVIDDISRYGRVDIPKANTWFCSRQMMLFDLIFEKIAEQDKNYLDVFLKWIFRSESPPPAYNLLTPQGDRHY